MEEFHSELGVITDLSTFEMRTSATTEMTAEGVNKPEIDILKSPTFSLYEAAEMGCRSNVPNSAGRCISIVFEFIRKGVDMWSADSPAQTPQRFGRREVFF